MKYFLSQAVHPLTTTGLAPLVLLSILNYKVFTRQQTVASNLIGPGLKRLCSDWFALDHSIMVLKHLGSHLDIVLRRMRVLLLN